MSTITRREFLGKSALGLGLAATAVRTPMDLLANARAGMVKMPIGFQVWTVKDKLIADFSGTLKMMAGLGYKSVEMCSPPGYEGSGFGPLMKYSATETKKIIEDAGLICVSSHYGMDELRKNLDERLAFAVKAGRKQMIMSSFGLPENATMSDWLRAADELNKMGEKTKKSGIQMGYHNHHMEFAKIDGKLIYDSLMKEFDPDLVKMQFQVAVISIGYKAADYFKAYPGRFISAHLADWSPSLKTEVPLGKGAVDWKEFFDTVKTGGVRNIFVEMGPEKFKESADYLKSL